MIVGPGVGAEHDEAFDPEASRWATRDGRTYHRVQPVHAREDHPQPFVIGEPEPPSIDEAALQVLVRTLVPRIRQSGAARISLIVEGVPPSAVVVPGRSKAMREKSTLRRNAKRRAKQRRDKYKGLRY